MLVYHYAFKALGVFLFIIEIAWFIGFPIKNEITNWYKMRSMMKWNQQTLRLLIILLGLLALLFIPWRTSVVLPAVMEAAVVESVYANEAARITAISVREGDQVSQNQLLMKLDNELLNTDIKLLKRQIKTQQDKLSLYAGNKQVLQESSVVRESIIRLQTQLHGLEKRQQDLVIRAEHSGVVTFVNQLSVGQWINPNQLLARIRSLEGIKVTAFIDEQSVHKINADALGQWVADANINRMALRVSHIDLQAVTDFPYQELTSISHGPVPVRESQQSELIPETALYRIDLVSERLMQSPKQRLTGVVSVDGSRQSLAESIYVRLAAIAIRESGF